MKQNVKSSICVIAAGCLWGIISVFIKILSELGLDSLECVAVRVILSAVILFIYICLSDKSKFYIELRDIIYFIGTGIFSIVLFSYCYFKTIELTDSASVPALLLYTAPVFVMILSAMFFKERITGRKILVIIITFLGLGLVTGAFTGGQKISALAFLFGISSGFCYALYSIFGKFISDKYHAVTVTFYTFLIAGIGVIPVSGIIKDIHLIFNIRGFTAAVGIALFSTALPFLLYTKGLQGMEAAKASILATAEPFMAAIVGYLLFHEIFDMPKVAGMLMIICAIIFINMGTDKVN